MYPAHLTDPDWLAGYKAGYKDACRSGAHIDRNWIRHGPPADPPDGARIAPETEHDR